VSSPLHCSLTTGFANIAGSFLPNGDIKVQNKIDFVLFIVTRDKFLNNLRQNNKIRLFLISLSPAERSTLIETGNQRTL